jgi:hypothetical protein
MHVLIGYKIIQQEFKILFFVGLPNGIAVPYEHVYTTMISCLL